MAEQTQSINKVQRSVRGVRGFIEEVNVELKKCTWPTRPELVQSTVVVIVSVAILAVVVSVSDLILMGLMRLVIR